MPRCSQVEHAGEELPRSRWSCEFQPNRAAARLNDDAKGQESAALALDFYDAGNRREHTFIHLETNAVAVHKLYPLVRSSNEAAKQIFPAGLDGRRAERAHDREVRHVECPETRHIRIISNSVTSGEAVHVAMRRACG